MGSFPALIGRPAYNDGRARFERVTCLVEGFE